MKSGHLVGNLNVYSARLRSQNRVVQIQVNNEACRRFYTCCASRVYNKLPTYVTSCSTIKSFLKQLKNWLFSFEDIEFVLNNVQ